MVNSENPTNNTRNEPNQWSILNDTAMSELQESKSTSPEKTLERAKLYRKFGKVALALAKYEASSLEKSSETKNDQESALKHPFTSPESLSNSEELQAESLITQIESALSDVDRSLSNQMGYSIINHKQINTREALEHELQSGTSIPELDIRFDKDGKPWISHSPRAGARFFFSKPIHTLSSEEVDKYGSRLSLEEGLELFEQYYKDNPNHRVVLELKELGPSPKTRREYLETIQKLLKERGLTETVTFATLSPSILRATHDVFPENSKILNGGIAPIISYNIGDRSLSEESSEDREFIIKAPNLELIFSNSSEISERLDGYGKQIGYLWTRLPKETVESLAKLNRDGKIGAASLTVVNKFANILDKLSPKTAKKLREHYSKELDKLGLRKQVAIAKKNPAESLKRTKEQIGQDAIIYSDTSPGDWATNLPKPSAE